MAPMTRRSQNAASSAGAGGVTKHAQRKLRSNVQRQASDSWELLDKSQSNPQQRSFAAHEPQEQDEPDEDDAEHEDVDAVMSIEAPSAGDVDAVVNPLREMAERVGREVETFAETLDKFLSDLPTRADKFEAARDLVVEFREIAEDAVAELKKSSEREMRTQLRKEWSERAQLSGAGTASKTFGGSALATSQYARKSEQVKELKAMQEEADTWELFRLILELHYQPDKEGLRREQEEELARMGQPHRYTPESEVWNRFLLQDDVGKERYLIRTWLEQTADHQQSDLQGIVEELEAKAGSGRGLWSKGWMHTREQIKAQKRIRAWPNTTDSSAPQIKRTDNSELLVTTLDPDSVARSHQTLEKPDAYFERAVWIACWEMLRRGMPWEEICAWCEERNEGWRAVSMGKATSSADVTSSAAWRRMCFLASQSGCSNEYEAAVYGLLGGSVHAVQKVGRTVDDHLYAYYSSTLLRQFDQYVLANCPDRMPQALMKRAYIDSSVQDLDYAQNQITQLIVKLRQRPATQNEATKPMKIIQSYLLANQLESFVHTLGTAIADLDTQRGGPEDMIIRRTQVASEAKLLPETDIATDPQALRIATHIALVLRELRDEAVDADDLDLEENVTVAYIQTLRGAGKRDLIPLYASKLQPSRYVVTLGQVLQDVHDPNEQQWMVRLLRDEYQLDAVAIFDEQLKWLLNTRLGGVPQSKRPLQILEKSDEKFHPGQRIMADFLPEEMDETDVAIIRALHWYQMIRGQWKATFGALSLALRKCLVTGRLKCARELIAEFPYETVSTRKSYEAIGMSLNLMEYTGSLPADPTEAMKWQLLKRQSRSYHELEKLVLAIESLAAWRSEELKYTSKVPKPISVPQRVKACWKAVMHAMNTSALEPGFLMNAVDEAEAADAEVIRIGYLPELLLAYNCVLHSAGNLITRDALLDSMDLSVAIANPPSSGEEEAGDGGDSGGAGLADCFQQAGRMRELVDSFAQTAKAMLVLKAEGKPWKAKKDRVGKELGMWEIAGAIGAGGVGDRGDSLDG